MELVRKHPMLRIGMCLFGFTFVGFVVLCSVQAFVQLTGDFTQDYTIIMSLLAFTNLGIMILAFSLNRPVLAAIALVTAVICILEECGICINLASQVQNSSVWWPTLYEFVFT